MFRPERMTSASIICLRKDLDDVLETLNEFGEFHIEHSNENSTAENYRVGIRQTEESLADINDLINQLPLERPSFTDAFRTIRQTKIAVSAENWQALSESITQEVTQLKKETEQLTNALASLRENRADLDHMQNMLSIMEIIGTDLAAMEELRLIHIAVASVPWKTLPELEKALTEYPVIFHRCYLCKDTEFVCMAFASKYSKDIEKILNTHHGEIFQISQDLPHNVTEALHEVNNRIEKSHNTETTLNAELKKLGKSSQERLAALKETSENILSLLQAKNKILQSGHLATVKGFVPKEKLTRLRNQVDSTMKGNVLVLENETPAPADPPTLVRHNRFVRPFEEITHLYGLPHYDEFDPTPIVAITFPLIFGLMFGDIGHGLVLLVGGLTIGFLIKNQSGIKNVCWILAACGIGAIIAGFLFGEFFGVKLFAPLWFDPFDNVLMFLIFSLFVGIIQIMSGLSLELVDYAFKRNISELLLTSIPKIAFYAGSVYLIAQYHLNFSAWFRGPILFAVIPFLILIFANPLAHRILKTSGRWVEISREQKPFVERLFESGDLVTRLLSNTVSYTRILALLMAHYALILVTYVVAGLIGNGSLLGMVLGAIIIVGGNIFVIGLEGLIVFIHTLRLHFYEWFSKFYQGTGTPFSPFKQNFKYTVLKLGKKADKS